MAQDFCAEVGCKLVYGLSAMYGACCVRYDDERTMYGTGHCEGCGAPALNRAAARVGCEYLNLTYGQLKLCQGPKLTTSHLI